MKNNQYLVLLVSILILSSSGNLMAGWKGDIRGENSSSNRNGNDANLAKKLSVGLSGYRTTIATSFSGVDDVVFSGPALSASYGFTDHIGIHASLFSLESETNNLLNTTQSDGYDLMLHFGTGFETDGFKAYGGLGLFKDKWSGDTNYLGSLSFSGIQFGGGLGYNWDNVSLDANINLRQASEYREFTEAYLISSGASGTGNGIVMSSALTLSVRF
jgi:hypothetical protein